MKWQGNPLHFRGRFPVLEKLWKYFFLASFPSWCFEAMGPKMQNELA
jgi:hypothetical protein